jgi:hypothetical protein
MEPYFGALAFDYDAETQRALDAIAHRASGGDAETDIGYLPISRRGAVRTLHVLPGDSVSDSVSDDDDDNGDGGTVSPSRLSSIRGMLLYAIRRLSAPEEVTGECLFLTVRDNLLVRTVEDTEYLLGVDSTYRGAGALARLRAAAMSRADSLPVVSQNYPATAAWARAVDDYYAGECEAAMAHLDAHDYCHTAPIAELEAASRALVQATDSDVAAGRSVEYPALSCHA